MLCKMTFSTFWFFVLQLSSQVPRKFTSKIEGKMGYEDFVYFMLSEEDKSSEPGLEYWYTLLFFFFLFLLITFYFSTKLLI